MGTLVYTGEVVSKRDGVLLVGGENDCHHYSNFSFPVNPECPLEVGQPAEVFQELISTETEAGIRDSYPPQLKSSSCDTCPLPCATAEPAQK